MFKLFGKDESDYNYFKTFEQVSSLIAQTTEEIVDHLNNYQKDTLTQELEAIQTVEISVDHLKKELMTHLYDDFLPPIEREDIIVLTHALTGLLEKSTDVLKYMDSYQVENIPLETLKLMELVVEATNQLPEMMRKLKDFKHPKKIYPMIEELNEIKNKGIQLSHEATKALFITEINEREQMKSIKIYDSLANVFTAIERVIYIVEAVIIQNT